MELDADLWKSLAHSKAPGLDIIGASFAAVPDEKSGGQFQRVFSFLRERYRWIVADLGRGFRGPLLQEVDEICVVTTIELAAQLGRHPDLLRLVLNEMPKHSPFTSANLEEMLGIPVWASIPYIPELLEIQGRSASLPRTVAVERAMDGMARLVAGIPVEKPKRRWPSI